MLYAPLFIAYAAAGNWASGRWALLAVAVTGAFLAREAAGRLIRKRGKRGATFWLCIYVVAAVATGLPLVHFAGPGPVVTVALAVVTLFALHSLLLVMPGRRRLDRSQWGEVLGVGALALTGPAAYAVATGKLNVTAWLIWAFCTLYFSSSIFYVKMWLAAARVKTGWNAQTKRRVSRVNLLYHALLTAIVVMTAGAFGGLAGIALACAFAPVLIRAFLGSASLVNKLPNLRRVGMRETLYALSFTGFLLASLRCLR
jgi:hypothetical protein